jgi:hypothetical protein
MPPEWPPPPAQIRIMPSTSAFAAFSACRTVVTSWKTMPPQPCTSCTISSGAPLMVMSSGTRLALQTWTSASKRCAAPTLPERRLILAAHGPVGFPVACRCSANSTSKRSSHSAYSAGERAVLAEQAAATFALHAASTSSG